MSGSNAVIGGACSMPEQDSRVDRFAAFSVKVVVSDPGAARVSTLAERGKNRIYSQRESARHRPVADPSPAGTAVEALRFQQSGGALDQHQSVDRISIGQV
jgi:hypothetical protein